MTDQPVCFSWSPDRPAVAQRAFDQLVRMTRGELDRGKFLVDLGLGETWFYESAVQMGEGALPQRKEWQDSPEAALRSTYADVMLMGLLLGLEVEKERARRREGG